MPLTKRESVNALGASIMLGTLCGLIVLVYTLVLRYDPEARGPAKNKGAQ